MYQLVRNSNLIKRLSDNSYFGPETREYEQYLNWRSEGNIPLDAPEELVYPRYQEFWDNLLVSEAYQKILNQAFTSLAVNTACTLFIAAFSDAKLGRANVPAIQNCINILVEQCNLSPKDFVEINNLLNNTGLDKILVVAPIKNKDK